MRKERGLDATWRKKEAPHLSVPNEPSLQAPPQLSMPVASISSPKTNPYAELCAIKHSWGLPGGSAGKESACNAGAAAAKSFSCVQLCGPIDGSPPGSAIPQCRRPQFNSWVRKIPWRRDRLPTLVFLPGESPWTEEPGGLQSVGSQRVRHDRVTKHSTAQTQLLF